MKPEPERTNSRNRRWLWWLIAPLLLLEAAVLIQLTTTDWTARVLLIGMIPSYFVVVAVHEAGHLMGGRLVGFQFLFVVVCSLKLARQGEKLRLSWAGAPALLGGMAASFPTDHRKLVPRMAAMIAGGPIASLLLSAAAVLSMYGVMTYAALAGHPAAVHRLSLGILLALALLSFLMFVLCAIPMSLGGLQNDAARLVLLWRGGSSAERYCALTLLASLALAGSRPRDWPSDLVDRANALSDNSVYQVSAALFGYLWALDQARVSEAESFLERAFACREKYPQSFRPGLYLEAAYFTARHRADAQAARAYLKQGKGGMLIEPYTRCRAEAAVLLAEGDAEGARRKASEGLAAIAKARSPGSAAAEADWLQEIFALAEAAVALPPIEAHADRMTGDASDSGPFHCPPTTRT